MARFREYSYEQTTMLPVALSRQIAPGTFEHAIHHLVDHRIDRSVFEARYMNDENLVPLVQLIGNVLVDDGGYQCLVGESRLRRSLLRKFHVFLGKPQADCLILAGA